MDPPKRTGGPAEGEKSTKIMTTIPAPDQSVAAELPAQKRINDVQVTIKFGSTSEADTDDSDNSKLYSDDKYSCDPDYEWMEPIVGVANVGHKRVADFDAKLIRRKRMRSAFWINMEGPSQETSDLAFELFDRYGCLNREYYDHEIRKGSGAWGRELDHGDILLFESLMVESLWRHQGIGTKVAKAILDKARAKSRAFFAFARPGCLNRDLGCTDEQEFSEAVQKQVIISKQFWLSLGFRRVGTSEWLAFTDDSTHPFRQLDVAQEWDEPERPADEPLPESVRTVLSILSDPSASDEKCVHQIQEAFPAEVAAPGRPYTDANGNTILHVAAMGEKAAAISYILAKYPLLSGIRNAEGHTPPEALQSLLEKHRTRRHFAGFTGLVSDDFKGFSRLTISCLAVLASTEAFDLTTLSKQEISSISSGTGNEASGIPEINKIRYTLRLKYGCTCGECIGGFLSPRMCFVLLRLASDSHAMLFSDLDYGSGPDWVSINRPSLAYLTTSVWEDMKTDQSMRHGFINMCAHIADCLRERWLPDEESVLRVYRRDEANEQAPVTHYLERGGTVAAVATMLFQQAMNEWAENCMYMRDREDEIEELPVCRNDHEFGFVKAMCGY